MITPYFLNLIAGNVMHSASVASLPETYYVALSTVIPTGDGSNFAEVTSSDYARGTMSAGSAPSNGSVGNLSDVEYQEATSDWGTVKAFGLYDAAEGGNLLAWNTLSFAQTIVPGNQVRFKPGALAISFQAETT